MENKTLVKILIGIIVALVLVIGSIVIGGGIYYIISTKNKLNEMEDRVKNIGAVIKYHNKSFLTAFFKIFYFVILLSKLP